MVILKVLTGFAYAASGSRMYFHLGRGGLWPPELLF